MLTPSQCRQYLNTPEFLGLSDKEIAAIRDSLYALAELALDAIGTQTHSEQEKMQNDAATCASHRQ